MFWYGHLDYYTIQSTALRKSVSVAPTQIKLRLRVLKIVPASVSQGPLPLQCERLDSPAIASDSSAATSYLNL